MKKMISSPNIIYNRPDWLVPYQLDILNDGSDLICCEGGTKSGKTAAMAILAIEEALNGKPGDEVYWVAPVSQQAKVGFEYIKEFIFNTPLMGKEPTTGSQAVIYLSNGVKIKFIGNGEDKKSTNRIYNNRAIFVIVDEASRCCPEVFTAVQSITTQTGGRICLIANVIDRKNWFYILSRKVERKEIAGSYYKLTYRDAIKAGILDEKVIDRIRNRMPEYEFAALYECNPMDDITNPFGLQHINNCIKDYDIKSITDVAFCGVDIGRRHDRTCVIGINNDCWIGLSDNFLNDHTLQRERIKNLVGDCSAYMDTTGMSAGDVYYDELSPDMPNLKPYNYTQASKKELVNNLALYIQKGLVSIPSTEESLIKELRGFTMNISTTGSISYSNDGSYCSHDDQVNALMMACMAHKDLNKQLPFDYFINYDKYKSGELTI